MLAGEVVLTCHRPRSAMGLTVGLAPSAREPTSNPSGPQSTPSGYQSRLMRPSPESLLPNSLPLVFLRPQTQFSTAFTPVSSAAVASRPLSGPALTVCDLPPAPAPAPPQWSLRSSHLHSVTVLIAARSPAGVAVRCQKSLYRLCSCRLLPAHPFGMKSSISSNFIVLRGIRRALLASRW